MKQEERWNMLRRHHGTTDLRKACKPELRIHGKAIVERQKSRLFGATPQCAGSGGGGLK